MDNPTTQWDRPVTDKELNQHYGKEATVRDEIHETLTETIRKVKHTQLSVPYVKHECGARIAAYSIHEVVTDYGTDPAPLTALLAVLAGSDCPLVAKYREALATRYADSWADYVEEVRG